MPHPLEHKINLLRRRVRRLVILYGVSWVIAAVLGATIVLAATDYATDYVIRFHDRGLRVICWLALLAAAAWACYRFVYRTAIARLRDVDLALRLERRFPRLEDRLLSAVEFIRQPADDPLAGSAALRRAVITQATAEAEKLDFSAVLDARAPLRAAAVSAAVCLLAAGLVVLDPPASQTAVARLVNPFGNVAWPQRTHLLLSNPVKRVDFGKSFELEVTAAEGTQLPEKVYIYYRFEDAAGTVTDEEPKLMQPSGDAAIAQRDNVTREFWYWVEGGDDQSMRSNPIKVAVVTPPAIERLSIELLPPAYTGWPPEKADRQIRALEGTQVRITAETSKPLKSAAFCREGAPPVFGHIGDDGYHFTVPAAEAPPVVLDKSGAYWFELTDREGLSGGSDTRWEIRALPDAPPSVTIEKPTADMFVTPRAVVLLRVSAKDDLAVHQVMLFFRRSAQAKQAEEVATLYQGSPQVPPQESGGLSGGADAGDRHVIDFRWELEGLHLAPGTQGTFYATATDYRPLPGSSQQVQTGKSKEVRLTVITAEQLRDRIAGRQSLVLSELERVLKMQEGCREQVDQLLRGLQASDARLAKANLDHVQAAELTQRQVSHSLTSRSEGVPMHVLALLSELENNRVDNPDVQGRMETLLSRIDALSREELPLIGRELTAAKKAAQVQLQEQTTPAPPPTAILHCLTKARENQDKVLSALRPLLDQLGRWDQFRRFYREIDQLLRDQKSVGDDTAKIGLQTQGRKLAELAEQQIADLKALAARQLELGRRLDRIEQEMEEAGSTLPQTDRAAAQIVADALEEARRLAVSAQVQSCGGQLQENQIGQALKGQKQIVQDLQEVLDILANRRQHELSRLVRKLHESEKELADLADRQARLGKQIAEAAQNPEEPARKSQLQRLGRDQEQLQQAAGPMVRRFERLEADQVARLLQQAIDQMRQAAESAGQNDAQRSGQHAQTAAQTLAEARRRLAARRLQAQAELAMESLARLEDTVKHLHSQQKQVLDQTQGYEGLRDAAGQLTRAQAVGVKNLAAVQESLQADTARLGDDFAGAGAFRLALSGAAADMGRAGALLDQRQTGAATQQAEKDALARLELLVEAVKPEKPDAGSADTAEGPRDPRNKPAGAVQTLAELKLLKLLQEQLNTRTQRWQQSVGKSPKPTPQQRDELAALREEQGRLADLVEQMIPPEEPSP